MSMVFSVIIPMYNEEEVIEESYKRLTTVMRGLGAQYELIFVNDGSRDGTLPALMRAAERDPAVKIIDFAKNFGHQIAVTAGLDTASGQAVVIIDADLQDPPELIPQMIEKWQEGFDVVYGHREKRRGESFLKKFTASIFYRFLKLMTGQWMTVDAGDFRLLDRRVVKAMRVMPEHSRYLRGMVAWVGFKQCPVSYVRDERWAGKTKYSLSKMFKLAFDGIISFSSKPLKVAGLLSGLLCAGGLIYLITASVLKSKGWYIDGWQFATSINMIISSAVLLCLNLIGVYVGRIYEEAKGRPIYIVSRYYGFEEDIRKEAREEVHEPGDN